MNSLNGLKNYEASDVPHSQKLNTGQNEFMQARGFKICYKKSFFVYLAYVLTLGCLRLFFHWYPKLRLFATYKKCSLKEATKILVIDDYQGIYKSYFVKDVKTVSTKNVNSKSFMNSIGLIDEELIKVIRNKNLDINLENGTRFHIQEYRAFWCKKQCYIWDYTRHEFSKLTGHDKYIYCSDLNSTNNRGLSRDQQILRRIVYGNNEILVPVQSVSVLIILEMLNPFYIFQMFSLAVWLAEAYIYYCFAIAGMSIFGVTSSVLQARKNQMSLRNTVASSEVISVLRSNGEYERISSIQLVPGDIIELPKHKSMIICDAILLSGTCVVNESMLTGESIPVTKTSLPPHPVLYDSKEFSHHTLFCGTSIIQTKNSGDNPVLAKVIRTGLQTNKGCLVTAILYPPPTDFKFDQDSYKFMVILAVVAFAGFSYTVISKITRHRSALNIAAKAFDIITIVIPPALPAVMTVGKMYAQSRLKDKQIFCINSRAINVAGSVNCICFDKTGTLTEDGLDMMGVVPNCDNFLGEPEKCISNLTNHKIFQGMLVCHSLSLINGELAGDPLDLKMFESTGWTLDEPDSNYLDRNVSLYESLMMVKPPKMLKSRSQISIIQLYQFSSTLQRMSAICQIDGTNYLRAYTKGSPEMILSLSKPETIPAGVNFTLRSYTEQGYRVIAIGSTDFEGDIQDISKLPRAQVEANLEFQGLIILENRLKEPTIRIVKELREANIKVLMITGDNIQTAVSVAKECGIVSQNETVINVNIVQNKDSDKPDIFFNVQGSPANLLSREENISNVERGLENVKYRFALTGNTWQLLREHYYDILPRICIKGAVFARMNSDQKQQLVVELMQLGYYVVMCGDGANDCGALRAAHVGISLSEAESSVASPFTSRIPNITCVPMVIQQGRAALVTSFGIFKFMIAYSLTEFTSTIILYSIDSNLTDIEYLFVDLFLAVNFAFFFGKTQAYTGKLALKPPESSIVAFTPLFSIVSHIFVITLFQVLAFTGVQQEPWFKPFSPVQEDKYSSYENYSVFCISLFQYVTLAVVFSKGKPYRRPIYTNFWFLMSLLSMAIVCTCITIYPPKWLSDFFELMMPPVLDWRIKIIGLAAINFAISMIQETFLIEWAIEKKIKPRISKPKNSKKSYLAVERQMESDPNWPRINLNLPTLPITYSVGEILNSKGLFHATENFRFDGHDNLGFIGDSPQGKETSSIDC